MIDYNTGEHERLIANLIRVCAVTAVDLPNARCMVDAGGMDSDWLPWLTFRAGAVKQWSPPSIGEQCVLLSPYGDMGQGVVLVGIYSDSNAAPSASGDKTVTTWPDNSSEEHDSAAKSHTITVPAGGKITLQVGSTSLVLEDGKATFDGTATVKKLLSWLAGVSGNAGSDGGSNAITGGVNIISGDVTADGVGLKAHHHTEHDGFSTSAAQG